ncbi:MAG: ABC transporter substrate-binding protein [Methanothrix sp.]
MLEIKKYYQPFLLALACMCMILGTGWAAEDTRTVVDSRGTEIQVPVDINRVVTIDDGLVEEMMIVFGVQDKLVGLGSEVIPKVWEFSYPTIKGENYTLHNGMHIVTYLNPWIKDLPVVGRAGTGVVNYEVLAGLDPDVVILRLGDCTFADKDGENTKKFVESMESLEIPLVVLYAPPCFDKPNVQGITEEIRILGKLFREEEKALKTSEYLESTVKFVQERTENIPDQEKPKVLMFGLSSRAREKGGAGFVHGVNTIESYFIEDIVNARNAYQEEAATWVQTFSAEQILALDPDVIVLSTAHGYHPPKELYEAPYYQNLQEMRAIKDKRVAALPWTPANCAKRLEYPIELMVIAKTAYPERFQDIDLGQWILDFYQQVYGVDLNTARALRAVQFMDWTVGS